jgi:hypothetical protein
LSDSHARKRPDNDQPEKAKGSDQFSCANCHNRIVLVAVNARLARKSAGTIRTARIHSRLHFGS